MVSNNIPQVKLGIIAVSRDCFPIALSTQRRENIVKEYKGEIFNCQTTVENEKDMLKAVAEVKELGCNALVVFLGNFGPETPETLIAKNFDGPVMFVAAAEGDGDMINGRGDAYCGMLNCSYNLGMRHLKGYIPEYPVGTAEEVAKMIADFVPQIHVSCVTRVRMQRVMQPSQLQSQSMVTPRLSYQITLSVSAGMHQWVSVTSSNK